MSDRYLHNDTHHHPDWQGGAPELAKAQAERFTHEQIELVYERAMSVLIAAGIPHSRTIWLAEQIRRTLL